MKWSSLSGWSTLIVLIVAGCATSVIPNEDSTVTETLAEDERSDSDSMADDVASTSDSKPASEESDGEVPDETDDEAPLSDVGDETEEDDTDAVEEDQDVTEDDAPAEETEGRTRCGGAIGDAACADDEYCAVRGDDACLGLGECTPRPDACHRIYRPVCGCDGETYSNDCVANSQGVSIAHDGPCEEEAPSEEGETCGGLLGLTCEDGSYCQYEVGVCGSGDQTGTCAVRPRACILIYWPVCGCDNKTYGNECAAAGAGVSVQHQGTCDEPRLSL